MTKPRYATTADEMLLDIATGDRFPIKSVEKEPQNMIVINKEMEGTEPYVRIRRGLIDERAYSLSDWIGDDEQPQPKAKKKAPPVKKRQGVRASDNCGVLMAKKDLVDLHQTLQGAADLILDKILIDIVKQEESRNDD